MGCFGLQKPSLNKIKGTQADIHMIEHRFSRLQGLWNEDRLNEKYLWTWFSEEPYLLQCISRMFLSFSEHFWIVYGVSENWLLHGNTSLIWSFEAAIGIHLPQSFFLNKVAGWRLHHFRKETLAQVLWIFRNF